MSYHQTYRTAEKISGLLKLIEPLIYHKVQPIPFFYYTQLTDFRQVEELIKSDVDNPLWSKLKPGDHWGKRQQNFILRNKFQIPVEWDKKKDVALYLPLGIAGDFSHPEGLVYIDGQPYAGCDRHHQEIILPAKTLDGKVHQLAIAGWTGLLENDDLRKLHLHQCALVQIDLPTRKLAALTRVAILTVDQLAEGNPIRARLLNALDAAFKVLDTREPFGDEFYASIPNAIFVLEKGIKAAGNPLDANLFAAGHAHIDVAWLWTTDQSRQKAARTFHTALRMMEQHPGFHFSQSQPQLYDFVRQDHPKLFKEIQERVKEGRWEVLGGMWVEADTNLSGAESLVRQFLLGRCFFNEYFGEKAESPVLWLPDVFGYCANLPQLIKLAGMEYFFSIKLSWNQYNPIPYDTFWWQGLDGTRVLTHFSPTPEEGNPAKSTYNAAASPEQVLGTYKNFKQKELTDSPLLMAYGYGDGGGGATREMVENLELMQSFPGLPRLKMDRVGYFFEELNRSINNSLPVWNGELYFELHRGTYTSQGHNKAFNRRSEFLLHDVEFLAAWAKELNPDFVYPHQELDVVWKNLCLNQFHDILPGSSIGEVYLQAEQQYLQLAKMANELKEACLPVISENMGGDGMVINPTSFKQDHLVCLPRGLQPGQCIELMGGKIVPVQSTGKSSSFADFGEIPPYSAIPFNFVKKKQEKPDDQIIVKKDLLENECLRIEFNAEGDITRICDKTNQREIIPPGTIANQLQAFEDRPMEWDAWDVDIFYQDKVFYAQPVELIEVIEEGPLVGSIHIKRQLLHSRVDQWISLERRSTRINFSTEIDWREKHILLKTAFPVNILAPTATYEVQFGNVERPTHFNTSWDWARFEVPAQKWVDLSEGDYGVSLINDCKYGHDIHANVIRLSLLRSPTMPDPTADQGRHTIRYSLLPHAGKWGEPTQSAAYGLNDPFIIHYAEHLQEIKHSARSLVSLDSPNLVIETIKYAEDGKGMIVRLYESRRCRGEAVLKIGVSILHATLVNLLEEKIADIPVSGNQLKFDYQPYQIISLRIVTDIL
jgi:alpha-mannosidase